MPNPASRTKGPQGRLRVAAFLRYVHNPAFSLRPAHAVKIEELPGYRPMPDPLSEAALETALGLRDTSPVPAKVIACSAGGDPCRALLREALACGADEAIWIPYPTGEPDGWILVAYLEALYCESPFDLGLFGAKDLDTETGQTGPMFSALAGLPFLDGVTQIVWTHDGRLEATRSHGTVRDRILLPLPACAAVQRSRPLRYPTLEGKIRSERTPLRPHPVDPGSIASSVLRERFAPPKPAKASAATDYAQVSPLDRVRKAYGMAPTGQKAGGTALQRLRPDQGAQKILEILKEERFIGTADPKFPKETPFQQ